MNRKRSILNSIYEQKRRKCGTFGNSNDSDLPADAKGALTLLRSQFPVEKFKSELPPIIMKHQIYAFISNRTEVDKQLNEMRRRGEIRLFKMAGQDEQAVVFLDDYKKYVAKKSKNNSTVEHFITEVVSSCPDISYGRDVLLKQYSLKEENISELVQNGILTTRDIGCYWLSIPQVGEFVKTFVLGRKTILQCIRRTKYKEILQHDLEQRKFQKTVQLGILYHIYDLIGADLVSCVNTSTGKMLRLPIDSQHNR